MSGPPSARTALLRGYAPAVAAYRDHRRQLQKESVLGRGPLLAGLQAGRRAALGRLRHAGWLRGLYDATHRQFAQVLAGGEYAGLIPLVPTDFLSLMELRLPFLADTTVLRHPTHAPAAEILPGLAPLRRHAAQVRRVLAQSRLDEPVPFRSVDDDGRLVVHGRDAPTVEALAGIAHELGHCLYERARPVRCALGQLASERLAQRWEEQAVTAYLRTHGGPEEHLRWWACQRRQDALNLHFFLAERADLYGTEPPDGFPRWEGTGTFRESLFTLPGYQVVYARASLARLAAAPPAPPAVPDPRPPCEETFR
ncbi:hypothetical protein ACFWAR_34330 [Streptomyces sp. NPDC059917]|uniref:hypothetical protein n=1 Tax=Streptomyces sp. NPDC059917 TaxID=3347002 RepID=UPI00366A3FF1